MSEAERSKWFFWNLHENLDEFRKLEPTLIGQVMCTQMTITEGQSEDNDTTGVEKQLSFCCKWHLRLLYSTYQNEEAFPIGEGTVDLVIANAAPSRLGLALQKGQKAYLDSDNSLYPNQIFLNGWISEPVWNELKEQLYNPSPNCQTDIVLRDNCIFPVKAGFDFVVGPPGSVGVTSMEFRAASYSADRRAARRSQTLQR
jgi:hypothetical protein